MSDQTSTATQEGELPFWRSIASGGRPQRVGTYGIDVGTRGIYDTRNPLNELTGKEWTYFTNSVWITAYPPVANQCGFDLRKIHPSPKPPFLMRDIVRFFTKGDEWILDPFVGVGGSLLGGALCEPGRNGVGLDINGQYLDAYKKVCEQQGLTEQPTFRVDAREMLSIDAVREREFELVLMDPPYTDLMGRPKNGQKKKLYGRSDPTPFSEDQSDLGNLGYAAFLEELTGIVRIAVSRLKVKRYLVLFCRDLQPVEGSLNLIHADIANGLSRIEGLVYRGMRIWHDQATDLYPFGYPYAFVMNQMHQYVLVFRKER